MRAKMIKVTLRKLVVYCQRVPYDMMRYDNCVPATEQDSHKLDALADTHWAQRAHEDLYITFKMFDIPGNGPNTGRWESHACKVKEILPWDI